MRFSPWYSGFRFFDVVCRRKCAKLCSGEASGVSWPPIPSKFRHDTRLLQHRHGCISRPLVPNAQIGTTDVQTRPAHPIARSRFSISGRASVPMTNDNCVGTTLESLARDRKSLESEAGVNKIATPPSMRDTSIFIVHSTCRCRRLLYLPAEALRLPWNPRQPTPPTVPTSMRTNLNNTHSRNLHSPYSLTTRHQAGHA